ncbi:hypothetical protein FQA39_LY08520 [Lamprigera yunnana]|nr:hypothetical protein FQA39_LY08520 [Lamprigera yunnana]
MSGKTDISLAVSNFNSTTTLAVNEVPLSESKNSLNEDDYNPFEHRVVEHPTSTVGSLIHILKSSLGTGILAMPNAFKNAGLLFGFVATIAVGYICTYSIHILVSASRIICKKSRIPSLGLAETCGGAFDYGPKKLRRFSNTVKKIVDVALIVTYFMGLCVYVVFIAESIEQLIVYWFPNVVFNTRLYMVMVLVPLLILAQIRELKYLVPFSFFANIFLVVSFGITLYYVFLDIPNTSSKPLFAKFSQLPSFFSTVIFAMEGVGVIMPVENSMKHPEHFLGCCGVLNISMGTVILIYATMGFFGFLKYGDNTYASITLNLPVAELPAQCVKLLIILSVFLTYTLQMYVPLDIIWRKVLSQRVKGKVKVHLAQIGIRCIFVTGTVIIAIAVPNLEPIITLVGAVCLSTLGILLPAVVDTILYWEELHCLKWKLTKNIFLSIFSIFALISGSIVSIKSLINDY